MSRSYYNPMNNGDDVWEPGCRVGEMGEIFGNQGLGWGKFLGTRVLGGENSVNDRN